MARKYIFGSDSDELYFVTCTVIRWIDIFTRDVYRQIVLNSLNYCQREKGLDIYAWVIMTNHLHMIIGGHGKPPLGDIMRDFKSFTSRHIRKALGEAGNESRQDWLQYFFTRAGTYNRRNNDFQLWQQDGSHPVLLDTREKMVQRLDYTHYNPVKAGFVAEPHYWRWSSAIDYAGGRGLLPDVIVLDL